MTQSGGGGEYSLGTATLTLRGDMQPLERDLARMRAVIAEMEKRDTKIPAPNIPPPKPPPPETQRGYEGLLKTIEALRRGAQGDGEAFTMLSQQLRGAGQAAAAAGGSGGFGGASAALGGLLGMAGKAIPGLAQMGLAATGLQAIFGGLQGAVNAVLGPLQQLSAEAGRLNKQVAEAGIFAAQSFAILGPDGKLVEGTARQMQMVRGAILKEYQGIQKEVANISGATASEIYEGFNIILQNIGALGEKGTLENASKLATRIAASMNTLGIPGQQLRQEVNALMMGNIGPDAMLAKKLGISSADVRREQSKGTFNDYLMTRLDKLYDGQKDLSKSLFNVLSNFEETNQAIQSEAGQPLERDTAQMLMVIEKTFKNIQASFTGFFKSIAEAVGPIIKVLGPVVSVLTSIGAIASSVGRVIMDVVGVATAALGFLLQPALVAVARMVEYIAKWIEVIAEGIGGAISPIKALFNASADADVDGVNSFFDRLIEGAEGAGKAIDSFNKKWAEAVLNFRLSTLRRSMMADGASEKDIQEAQNNLRENFNRQTGLTQPVELRSLKLPPDVLEQIEAREQRLGFGAARALLISKEWSEIKQKAYQNEIKALEQGLTLMNKQREVAEAMSAVAASRRALEARGYELGAQVAASPEAKAAAEARLADLKLRQEKEAIAERRGILQTERELQQRQMLIQEKQIKIQQEQLKIQLAEAVAEQVRAQKTRDALLGSLKNVPLYSAEWGKTKEEISINAAELTRINAKLEGSRRAVQLAFEAEGQLGTITALDAQRLGLQEQQLDIQGQQAQYTREQQRLLAEISEAELNISNMLDEIVNKEKAKKRELEDQSEEINRQNTLLERQGRLEKAQAELAMTREKAAVQAAERLAELQELQDRARSGGGTAAVIEAQIAAAAAGVSGMESAAEVQQRLFDAKERQMAREHQLAQRQLEVQHKIEEIKLRSENIAMERQKVDIAIERARLTAELGRLRLRQMEDEIAPRLPGASSVPSLGSPDGSRAPQTGQLIDRLGVAWQSQLDNASGQGWRECFTTVSAMIASGATGRHVADDEYNKIRRRFGDTTSMAAQVSALRSMGIDARGTTSARIADLRKEFAQGRSIGVGITSDSGTTSGHWAYVSGMDDKGITLFDPNKRSAWQRRMSWQEFQPRFNPGGAGGYIVSAPGRAGPLASAAGSATGNAPPAPILPPPAQGWGVPAAPSNVNPKLLKYMQAARAAGFTGEDLIRMTAVGMAESSGNPGAINNNPKTGDLSFGAWQVNMIGDMGPQRRRQYGLANNEALLDLNTNARVAKSIFDSQGITAWGAYTDGRYKQYMGQARAAAALPAGSVANTVAAVGGVVAPSTANKAEALQQELNDLDSAEARRNKLIEDNTQALKDLKDLFSVQEENLTEQQLAERAQLAYERTKAQLTAEVMRTPEGRLAISTGDAVSGSISGSISGALQALLTGGDVKAAVSSALAQAGQTLMQATLDALLNPLLSQLQNGIVKTFTGIDIQGRALQMAAAAHQNAASAHQAAAVQVANAGAAVAAAAGASGAAAVGDSANVWGTLASKIPSLISGFAGLGGGLNVAFDSAAAIGGLDFSAAAPMLNLGSPGLSFTPGFAGGGEIQYGLDYLVGEKNAEIVRFNRSGGKIYSNRALTKALGVPFQRTPGGGAEVADGGGDSLGIPFMAPGPAQRAGGRAGLPPIPFLKASPGSGGGMAGSGPGGAPPAAMAPSKALRLKVETQVINGVEYATVEQVHQAAAAAAAASRDAVYNDLRNNPSIQRSVGLG